MELLEDVDRILERRNAPECITLPEGSSCWLELTSHPGCFVRNRVPQATGDRDMDGRVFGRFRPGFRDTDLDLP